MTIKNISPVPVQVFAVGEGEIEDKERMLPPHHLPFYNGLASHPGKKGNYFSLQLCLTADLITEEMVKLDAGKELANQRRRKLKGQ